MLLHGLLAFLVLFPDQHQHLLLLEGRLYYFVVLLLELVEVLFEFLVLLPLRLGLSLQFNHPVLEDLIGLLKITHPLLIYAYGGVLLLEHLLVLLNVEVEVLALLVSLPVLCLEVNYFLFEYL